jgi:hypothetical protein
VDDLIELSDAVFTVYENNSFDEELELACANSIKDISHIVFTIMAWQTRDAIVPVREVHATSDGDLESIDDLAVSNGSSSRRGGSHFDAQGVVTSISAVLSTRERLVDLLATLLGVEFAQADGSPTLLTRKLQRDAFQMVGDLRLLYPLRESQCQFVDKLAFSPSADLLAKLRLVFETEGQRIKEDLVDADSGAANKLSSMIIESLLHPLSRSMYYDVENLNRRQAAAVIGYLADPNEKVSVPHVHLHGTHHSCQ